MKNKIVMPYEYKGNPGRDVLKIKGNKKLFQELEKFSSKETLNFLNVPNLLEKYRKKTYPNEDLTEFIVRYNYGIDYDENGFTSNPVYMNVPYHLFLRKKEKVVAVLGFEPHASAILIAQIQNARDSAEDLRPLKWSNGLVNISLEWAKQMKIPEVWLLPRQRNCSHAVKEKLLRTQALYDKTAIKEGFKYDSEMQVFRIQL